MWHIPTSDGSITIAYSVKTEPVTDSPSASITDSPSARITDSPSARITDSPSARITDSPFARITDSPSTRTADSPYTRTADSPYTRTADSPYTRTADSSSTRTADSPSADLSWGSIQSPPIISTPFIRRPARRTPYSRRNQNEEIRQKQEMQLKVEIQYLNDRLSSYKKLARYLNMENSLLKEEVQTSQETIREISNFSTMFDMSVNKVKFDQLEIKCENLDIDNKYLRDANKNLKNELEKQNKYLKEAKQRFGRLVKLIDTSKYMVNPLHERHDTPNKIERQTTQVKSSGGKAIEELTL